MVVGNSVHATTTSLIRDLHALLKCVQKQSYNILGLVFRSLYSSLFLRQGPYVHLRMHAVKDDDKQPNLLSSSFRSKTRSSKKFGRILFSDFGVCFNLCVVFVVRASCQALARIVQW